MTSPQRWRRLSSLAVVAVALHSYAVGALLSLFPVFSLQLGGWDTGGTVFFVRQGGAFHFVVATAYLLEFFRHREIFILLVAKAIGVAFLGWSIAMGHDSPLVWLSLLGDAAMAGAVFFLHRRAAYRGEF